MPKKVSFYIDESYIQPDEVGGKGAVVVIGLVAIEERYEQLILEKLQAKKQSRFYQEYQAKFHHCEDPLSVRSDIANSILRIAPLSAYCLIQYVAGFFDEASMKKAVYQDAFAGILLPRVISKYRKIHGSDLLIDIAFEKLTDKADSDRRFFEKCLNQDDDGNIFIRIISKDNIFTTLPDYIVSILGLCIKKGPAEKMTETARVNARLIQDRIGLIIVGENKKYNYFERGEEVKKFIGKRCLLDI